jgi:hypothetical protein
MEGCSLVTASFSCHLQLVTAPMKTLWECGLREATQVAALANFTSSPARMTVM